MLVYANESTTADTLILGVAARKGESCIFGQNPQRYRDFTSAGLVCHVFIFVFPDLISLCLARYGCGACNLQPYL